MSETRSQIHANQSAKWGTPGKDLGMICATIGSDYHDPCPSDWQPGDPDGATIDNVLIGQSVYINHPGGRGQFEKWWEFAKVLLSMHSSDVVWCAFRAEQIRLMMPDLINIGGWLIYPDKRIHYIWIGETNEKNTYGEPGKSPANYSFFWSSVEPKGVPDGYIVMKVGADNAGGCLRG